jgi:hypothetical protein
VCQILSSDFGLGMTPAAYVDERSRRIGVLQNIQPLLPITATLADVANLLACIEAKHGKAILLETVIERLLPMAVTLADATGLLACVKAKYGAENRLEDVIQSLVGEQLTGQIEKRAAARRLRQGSPVEVAA